MRRATVPDFSKLSEEKAEVLRALMLNPEEAAGEMCRRSLFTFEQEFWDEVSSDPPIWNWHIPYLCSQLEQVIYQVIEKRPKDYDLIINVPPGTTKSITTSIMLPAWAWTIAPWLKFITASYSQALSLDHAEKSRDLIRSDKFHAYFPYLDIKQDKDTKSNFRIVERRENGMIVPGGNRYTTSIGGTLTGFHGHVLIVDDPLNPKEAISELKVRSANYWMEQTLSTRKVDKAITPTILIMQRLHEDDPTGHLLAKKKSNVRHICLPGEITNYGQFVRPIELIKNYQGDLLDPVRMPWPVLEDMQADLGQFGFAGQIGQNPVPPGGGMFKVDFITSVDTPPDRSQIIQIIRFWDKAATAGGGAHSCGAKMAKLRNGCFLIMDVRRGQWGTDERERIIRSTAEADGPRVMVYVEQEPGPIWEKEYVLMEDGSRKRLNKIEVGDRIIDGTGKPARVKAVHLQGKLPCLCITTTSGRVIRAAPNHPFLTPTGYVPAGELKVGSVLGLLAKRETTPTSFPTLEECRLAGYFVGDGCCTFRNTRKPSLNSINAIISCMDPIQGEDIIHCAESVGSSHNRYWKGDYNLTGGIYDWLRKRKLAGKRTETKVVPRWVITASDDCVANFIGAYLACDGYAACNKSDGRVVEFYSVNLPLLTKVQSLLLRFGVYSKIRRKNYCERYGKNRQNLYTMNCCRGRYDDSAARFAQRIPVYGKKSQYLARMVRLHFDFPYLADDIVSIENTENKLPCRCLEIDGDPSFVVNDFVVHNSSGKDSAQSTIRNLAGYSVHADRPTGDKTFRADPFSVQVNNGNVQMLRGIWNQACIEELRYYPFSRYKDQTDSLSGCFNLLAQKRLVSRVF